MATIRRFSAPIVKSAFTPETWDVHQAGEDVYGPPVIGPSGRPSTALGPESYHRLMARLRRITPHTIREGRLASPFVEHRSSFPTATSDPYAYGGPISIPGGWGT